LRMGEEDVPHALIAVPSLLEDEMVVPSSVVSSEETTIGPDASGVGVPEGVEDDVGCGAGPGVEAAGKVGGWIEAAGWIHRANATMATVNKPLTVRRCTTSPAPEPAVAPWCAKGAWVG